MTDTLFDPAPGFDQPIAVLKHCHDRIRRQLATLRRLLDHLPVHGADAEAQQAARAVLNYFEKAAELHHADEEQDLLPMLHACARGADAAMLAEIVPLILLEHDQMYAMWQGLHEQLAAIADARAATLSGAEVQRFADCYAGHMEREEGKVAPMAKRLFSAAQMAQLGQSMQARRGLAPHAASQDGAPDGVHMAAQAAHKAAGLAQLRTDYGQASLSEADVAHDPYSQFSKWFEEALAAQVAEPNAMGLSTVDAHGKPSSRIVLIKQFDSRGFTWYTNYHSDKGRQLASNPHAALLFFWSELERQIRIEGKVELTSPEESDKYFHSRPLKSRLAAMASQQSEPVADRAALEGKYDAVASQFGDAPPRPDHWGGYRLVPERIEFWQGRRSRFHDRIVYLLQDDGSWMRQRLQP
ncbi:MAG: pyridoxamine 5'-phosphate oxidase [Pseudomonadota bacterium]